MACFKPLKGYRHPSGKITFNRSESTGTLAEVPCGQCIGCRLDHANQWAIRCMHEAQIAETNSFITLTYDDTHVPRDGSLNKAHFQKFMKRFRKEISPQKIRYFHCGEYGDDYSRPHYHALIFGYDFPDKQKWSQSHGDNWIHRSKQLERLWDKGFSTIGAITVQSAAYCARYSIKKLTGKALDEIDPVTGLKPYEKLDPMTGEILAIQPEYATMSRRPGIGRTWYEKYKDDVFPDDFVVMDGKKRPTPNYYRRLLADAEPELAEELLQKRVRSALKQAPNQTHERLAVRETCKQAQAKVLTRKLHAT